MKCGPGADADRRAAAHLDVIDAAPQAETGQAQQVGGRGFDQALQLVGAVLVVDGLLILGLARSRAVRLREYRQMRVSVPGPLIDPKRRARFPSRRG
jgi:hypothetical protein